MRWLSDDAVERLRRVADWPDLDGTRYRAVELLGRGGMGAVYRALDDALDREVALKVLHDPTLAPDLRRRMVREARILARLEHPGIVPVHDVGELPDGRVFYVMKLVRGERLDRQVTAATPLADRLRILERICETVAFAHAHGVVHRDLKPDNVMVGAFGEVLVLDWGVAKLVETETLTAARADAPAGARDDGATAHGTVLGTPAYMAPEQAAGAVDAVDARTDVYGLGALLYFLLVRRAPEPDAAPLAPRAVEPAVPRPLDAICARATQPAPAARYPAAGELAADLRRFLAGGRVRSHRETVAERAWRVAVRYRVPIVLVLAYLVVRVVMLVVGRI